MKPIYAHLGGALALSFAIAACVPQPRTPPPAPPARPAPAPAPMPAPAADAENWMDAPQTAGDWSYRAQATGGIARFADPRGTALLSLRCDRAARAVVLSRTGQANGARTMIVRTETVDRTLAVVSTSNQAVVIEARLAANDPLLDAMAISKGRFAIEVPGQAALFVPSWAEVTRVIEDCR